MSNDTSATPRKRWFQRPWLWVVGIGLTIGFLGAIAANSDGESVAVTTTTTTTQSMMEWRLDVGETTTLLRGGRPSGYPTETWLNGVLLSRDEEGDFSWDLAKEVPSPVSIQDDMSCEQLQSDIDFWLDGAAKAVEDGLLDSATRQAAYAGNAINLQVENEC